MPTEEKDLQNVKTDGINYNIEKPFGGVSGFQDESQKFWGEFPNEIDHMKKEAAPGKFFGGDDYRKEGDRVNY